MFGVGDTELWMVVSHQPISSAKIVTTCGGDAAATASMSVAAIPENLSCEAACREQVVVAWWGDLILTPKTWVTRPCESFLGVLSAARRPG